MMPCEDSATARAHIRCNDVVGLLLSGVTVKLRFLQFVSGGGLVQPERDGVMVRRCLGQLVAGDGLKTRCRQTRKYIYLPILLKI